jgi:hypothetical protein
MASLCYIAHVVSQNLTDVSDVLTASTETRRNIPEVCLLHTRRRENFKSQEFYTILMLIVLTFYIMYNLQSL